MALSALGACTSEPAMDAPKETGASSREMKPPSLVRISGDQETDRSRNRPRSELVLDTQVTDMAVAGVGALIVVVAGDRQLVVRQEGQADTDVVDVLARLRTTDHRSQLGEVDHAEGRGRSVIVELTRVANAQFRNEASALDRNRVRDTQPDATQDRSRVRRGHRDTVRAALLVGVGLGIGVL